MSIAVGLAWYAQLQKECEELRAELARLRLTDAEREAVERSAAAWEADARMGLSDGGVAATLRGLLGRIK